MADETTEGENPDDGDDDKKPRNVKGLVIKIVPLLLIALVAAKMTVLKPPPPTKAQVEERQAAATYALDAKCALANKLAPPKPPPDMAKPRAAAKATTTTSTTVAPATGPVLELDSKTMNLDGTHFLKIGISLQLPVGSVPDTVKTTENWSSVASQLVIDTFSGRSLAELSNDGVREQLERQIGDDVCRRTDGKVVTVYFIDFVMQ